MPSEDYRRSQANTRMLAELYRRVDDADRGAPLRAGGVGAGGITIKGGSLRIEAGGNIEVDGDATFGGDTTVGGNMRVTGTLSLPAGIINNAALANPLQVAEAENDANGFGLSTTETVITACTIPVPAGFTRALVIANGSTSVYYPGDPTYMWARVYVWYGDRWAAGRGLGATISNDVSFVSLSPMKQDVVTGLSGGVIRCELQQRANDAIPARPDSGASINAYAIFSR